MLTEIQECVRLKLLSWGYECYEDIYGRLIAKKPKMSLRIIVTPRGYIKLIKTLSNKKGLDEDPEIFLNPVLQGNLFKGGAVW